MHDLRCWRDENGTVACSIPHHHVHHSPTGFEIGYGGSGPADLALNILALAIGPPPDPGPEPSEDSDDGDTREAWAAINDRRVKLYDDSYVHADAWDLHQAFKWDLIATMPRAGGTIAGALIEAWITAKQAQFAEHSVD